jgi:ketosteroid isomerase-like protein
MLKRTHCLFLYSVLFACFSYTMLSCSSVGKSEKDQQNAAIVKQLFEYFNKHNWVKMVSLYSDPADFKDPSFGKEIIQQTRRQTIDKYSEMEKMSPDIKDSIIQVYRSEEKYIVVEFISSGTADGKRWSLPLCDIFTIENGQIVKDFTYYDRK